MIPAHLTLQRELNAYEEANILEATEWLFGRRRGDPLDERFIYAVHGRLSRKAVEDAVSLSKNKYCSVSKMLEKSAPVDYEIVYPDGEPER